MRSPFFIFNTEYYQYMAKKSKSHRNTRQNNNQNNHFELRTIKPLTPNQDKTFSYFDQGHNLMLHGSAGTGKTFCALYLALREILSGNSEYDKIIIIRSVVPSRDMGFLPGSSKEKSRVYEEPYQEICDDLFGRGDGYEILKMKKIIEFTTTSFLRGLTFNKAIVIVDECQNMNFGELSTIMTRIGDVCKVIFCGDTRQTDFQDNRDKTGLRHFVNILKKMPEFKFIEFYVGDIVRSGVVKSFIINMDSYMNKIDI